jgi:hypothetical protein
MFRDQVSLVVALFVYALEHLNKIIGRLSVA